MQCSTSAAQLCSVNMPFMHTCVANGCKNHFSGAPPDSKRVMGVFSNVQVLTRQAMMGWQLCHSICDQEYYLSSCASLGSAAVHLNNHASNSPV